MLVRAFGSHPRRREHVNQLLLAALLPVIATVIGAGISLAKQPGPAARGFIQHFAAGVVFSVVSVELLPDVIKRHAPPFVILGFGLGVLLMLALKSATKKLEQSETKQQFPTGLIVAVAIDVLLDGFLIGIGFAAGAKEGVLLTAALTLELLSLGLAIAVELTEAGLKRRKVLLTTAMVASLIVVGAFFGSLILSHAPDKIMETLLSFGLAALLFLVTEELLVEAHEQPETPLTTAAFFVGFLLFLILGMVA